MRDITDAGAVSWLSFRTGVRGDRVLAVLVELSNLLREIRGSGQDTRVFLGSLTVIYKASEDKFYVYI